MSNTTTDFKKLAGREVTILLNGQLKNVRILQVGEGDVWFEYEDENEDIKTGVMKEDVFNMAFNREEPPANDPPVEQPTSSKKKESFWETLLFPLGCFAQIIILALVALGINLLITKCDNRRNAQDKEAYELYKAKQDSIKRIESIQQELWLKECDEHRKHFYTALDKYYHTFESEEEFDDWLCRANYAAFELLHELYSMKYDDYDGPDGIDRMAEYLFWGPPEYDLTCDNCGESMSFSEDEDTWN